MNEYVRYAALLAVVMFALPIVLRIMHGNTTLPGTEPYYHARMSERIVTGVPATDDAIVWGRPYHVLPYEFLLGGVYLVFGTRSFTLVPFLLAVASFFIFWILIERVGSSKAQQGWMLLVFSLSPAVIAAGFFGTPHAFLLVLVLLAAVLMMGRGWPLGAVLFLVCAFSGVVGIMGAVTFLLLLAFLRKGKIEQISVVLLLIAVIFVIGIYPPTLLLSRDAFQYLSDVGGVYGFSVFAVLLAVIGAIQLMEYKLRYYGVFATVFFFVVGCFFFPDLLIFGSVIVSMLAGVALASFATRKWTLQFIRAASMLVLFCGLLFSGISHAVALADVSPTPSMLRVLNVTPGVVFSHEKYGFWIEAAGHRAVIDGGWEQSMRASELRYDADVLLGSTDLEKTRELLEKYNVTYVLITAEMEHGLVWEREEQGLDFLVENSETFKKIDSTSKMKMWKVR